MRGEHLSVLLGSANRDPGHFIRPDDFDINRKPNKHLAFGAGLHVCLGASLGRMQARVAFKQLFRALLGIQLVDETPKWKYNTLFRGLESLPVQF